MTVGMRGGEGCWKVEVKEGGSALRFSTAVLGEGKVRGRLVEG